MTSKEMVYEVINSIVLEDEEDEDKNIINNSNIYKKEEIYNEQDEDNEEDISLITKKMVEIEEEVYKVYLLLDKYREENKCISDILKYVELKDVYKLIYPDYEGLF